MENWARQRKEEEKREKNRTEQKRKCFVKH